jgi:hypothetical protein
VLSPELTQLLDSAGSPDLAAREIIGCPALLDEVRQALPALRNVAFAKAGEDGVRAVIGRRLATYPQPARSEGEWDAWWADYFDVLADVGLASLEAAMRAYVALPDSEFMPKPGRLRELAFTAPCRSLQRFNRASRAIALADERLPDYTPPNPPADPAAVKQWLEDYRAGRTSAKDQSQLPSIAGKPDETGITPQMREVLARRS